ncbi:MAG: adenosylcobinamide-GDP ribazoletransferase [Epulopiscium sp.]|nr:adenosylcobinamide-GDP ribazoletransferase [Candidatus Epulonipiscium sp.]
MKLFLLTLRFLTRIPVPYRGEEVLSDEEFSKGVMFYPLIGLLVGLLCGGVYFLFTRTGYPLMGAAAAVFFQICITGAFHLDGLVDTCDGLFSARKKETMLEIMRDSRVGTNGAIAVVFDILWKVLLIAGFRGNIVYDAIIFMPVAGKTITPILMHSAYAREKSGLGSIYLKDKYTLPMMIAMGSGTVMLCLWLGIAGAIALFTAFVSGLLVRFYCNKKIGGMTGDTLGAGCEVGEIIFLMSMIFLERWGIWT